MTRVLVFVDAGHAMEWERHNCEPCVKGAYDPATRRYGLVTCEIEAAMFEAWVKDGRIDGAMAMRAGCVPGRRLWRCAEFE